MRNTSFILALAFAACDGKDKDTDPVETDETDPAEDTFDSALVYEDLTGQVGSVSLIHYPADARGEASYLAVGIFADDAAGLLDAAGCLIAGNPCLTSIGEVGGEATLFDFETLNATPLDAGLRINLAGTTLFQDDSQGYPLYVGEPTAWTGSGLSFDGDLAPYEGTDTPPYVTPLVATLPVPTDDIILAADDTSLDFAWEPGTTGDVLLSWGTGALHLDDNGSYTLDLAAMELRQPYDVRVVQLLRVARTTVDAAGNDVEITTTSSQWYYLDYTNTEGLTELAAGANVGETCADAGTLPTLGAGSYFGTVSENTDDHDLGDGNPITDYEAPGNDIVLPIALTDGQILTVTARHTALDTSIYLLPTDCDEADALAGADATLNGDDETFTYTADADGTVFLVIDAFDEAEDSRFGVTIEIADP